MVAKGKAVPAWEMRLMDFTARSGLGMASDDGGDVGRIMRAAVRSPSPSGLCDVTWGVILRPWMDGHGRDLPPGFLVEDLSARTPCLNA